MFSAANDVIGIAVKITIAIIVAIADAIIVVAVVMMFFMILFSFSLLASLGEVVSCFVELILSSQRSQNGHTKFLFRRFTSTGRIDMLD